MIKRKLSYNLTYFIIKISQILYKNKLNLKISYPNAVKSYYDILAEE